ncbi:MAG: glycosyltransferase family 4 protein [Bacteroidota bacterium]
MKELNVLMVSRATLFSHPGGDTMQIRKTAAYLNKLEGVSVDIKTVDQEVDYSQYDLLHLFNISRPADLLGVIKKSRLPYVISTIFVDFTEAEKNHHSAFRSLLNRIFSTDQVEYLKTIARILKGQDILTDRSYLWRGQKKSVLKVIKNSRMLLPNSQSEYNRLLKAYGAPQEYRVIPNAIDINTFSEHTEVDHSFDTFEGAVISVGQITPVKNHLSLIRALKDTEFKVFIIGSPSSNAGPYFEKCREEATKNIVFVPFMEQGDLVNVYRKAKVHALASWFETTGLVSLEAAYMGCNVVVTDRGDQKEYFKNHAFYCDPERPESILEAVKQAHQSDFRSELKNEIEQKYTWEITARKTLDAYRKAGF